MVPDICGFVAMKSGDDCETLDCGIVPSLPHPASHPCADVAEPVHTITCADLGAIGATGPGSIVRFVDYAPAPIVSQQPLRCPRHRSDEHHELGDGDGRQDSVERDH
jgi:hypothetical protein